MTTLIVTSSAHGSTREIAERVAEVLRDYGLHEREQAPVDSREIHEQGTAR
mgnify:CR=1 FL=1